MIGRSFTGFVRSSLLIDEAGKIMGAWYKIKTENTIPEAKKVLGPLRRAFLGEGSGVMPRFYEASNQN
jgi:peroxiredoxin